MKMEFDSCAIEKFQELISASHSIVITAHQKPDGDAIGSCLGLSRFIADSLNSSTGSAAGGRHMRIILPDPVPDNISFIVNQNDCEITSAEENESYASQALGEADLIICLDFNSPSRTRELESALRSSPAVKILIDHHLGPEKDFFTLCFSEPEMSSTCELLFWILKSVNEHALTTSCLEPLMLGMTTDTNNFSNSTTPSTLSMASFCLERGVDRGALLSRLYNSHREERFRLMGYMLSEKLKITPNGVAYCVFSEEELEKFDIREGETEGFVNIALGIANVRMSIMLKENDGIFRVSIRSKNGTSANRCAREWFNGGGHELAAGGKLDICPELPDSNAAEAYILKVTDKFFNEL